jgi:tetratricopeptide (TPR) repeat protein
MIASYYSAWVIGEVDKAAQAYQQLTASYPRDAEALNGLGLVYMATANYEKALQTLRQSERLNPNGAGANSNLGNCLLALQRLDQVPQAVHTAQARKIDNFFLHAQLYALAFLRSDTTAMADELKWFKGRPVESLGLSLASNTAAYEGHLSKARELTQRALDSALQADSKENGAVWLENAALREAAFGNNAEAKRYAAEGLKLAPTSKGVDVEGALAYAMAGDNTRADSLAKDLNKRFPVDTQVQSLWLPAIRARLDLDHHHPAAALNRLQAATGSVEMGQIPFLTNLSCLEPTYIRGEAYLASGQGGAAAAQFQKILDHGGLVWNCWTGALAHLGVARAEALEARSSEGADAQATRAKALAAYKNFLTLWKTADPDIPILKQARAEYARLQ